MIITTTYEQFRNLPKNKGRDTKVLYKEWLLEEAKLLLMYDAWTLPFHMQYNNFNLNVYGPGGATSGGSQSIPPIPTNVITYYIPNGVNGPGPLLGYYTPDTLSNSYYVYVTI
jgi:hypothetical protein